MRHSHRFIFAASSFVLGALMYAGFRQDFLSDYQAILPRSSSPVNVIAYSPPFAIGRKTSSNSKCAVPVYGDLSIETRWFLEVLFSRMSDICGCSILMLNEEDFHLDYQPWKEGTIDAPPYPYAVIVMHDKVYNEDYLDPFFKDYFATRVTLISLSDEGDTNRVDHYPYFRYVYRNYYSDFPDRAPSLKYLRSDHAVKDDVARIKWLPLGYSINLLVGPSWMVSLSQRPYLFSFAGSIEGKDERGDMLVSLDENPKVKAHGLLHTYSIFGHLEDSDHLQAQQYSQRMHHSIVIPCPSGGSPEQFRISETFEVGAIPMIIVEDRPHLRYLDEFGFKYIEIDNFRNTAEYLQRVDDEEGYLEQLEDWRIHNTKEWGRLKSRLAEQFAIDTCTVKND